MLLCSRPSPRLNLQHVNSLEPHSCLGSCKGLIPVLQVEKLRLLIGHRLPEILKVLPSLLPVPRRSSLLVAAGKWVQSPRWAG